jgi:hypothetical protein
MEPLADVPWRTYGDVRRGLWFDPDAPSPPARLLLWCLRRPRLLLALCASSAAVERSQVRCAFPGIAHARSWSARCWRDPEAICAPAARSIGC